jgi:hypothetical protein
MGVQITTSDNRMASVGDVAWLKGDIGSGLVAASILKVDSGNNTVLAFLQESPVANPDNGDPLHVRWPATPDEDGSVVFAYNATATGPDGLGYAEWMFRS